MQSGIVLNNGRFFGKNKTVWQSLVQLRRHHSFRGKYDLVATGFARMESIKETFLLKGGWYACAVSARGLLANGKLFEAGEDTRYAAIVNFRRKEVRIVTTSHDNDKLTEAGFKQVPLEVESAEHLVAELWT